MILGLLGAQVDSVVQARKLSLRGPLPAPGSLSSTGSGNLTEFLHAGHDPSAPMIKAATGQPVEAAQERPPHTPRHDVVVAGRSRRGNGGTCGGHADSLARVGAVVCKPMGAMFVRLCRRMV